MERPIEEWDIVLRDANMLDPERAPYPTVGALVTAIAMAGEEAAALLHPRQLRRFATFAGIDETSAMYLQGDKRFRAKVMDEMMSATMMEHMPGILGTMMQQMKNPMEPLGGKIKLLEHNLNQAGVLAAKKAEVKQTRTISVQVVVGSLPAIPSDKEVLDAEYKALPGDAAPELGRPEDQRPLYEEDEAADE